MVPVSCYKENDKCVIVLTCMKYLYIYELILVLNVCKIYEISLYWKKKISQCAVGLKEFNELVGCWRRQKKQFVLLLVFCFLHVIMWLPVMFGMTMKTLKCGWLNVALLWLILQSSHIRIYTANTILKLKKSKATDKPSSQGHAQTF